MTKEKQNGAVTGLAGRAARALGGGPALAVFAVVAAVAVAVRCVELGMWDDPRYMVFGEHLMASHDAYAWLAGAKGVSRYATQPLSRFVAFLHGAFGFSLGDLGFWLPVLMAPPDGPAPVPLAGQPGPAPTRP